ncbi:MAG TPA: hypothetical protein VJ714_07010 [Anaerolineae bacterium]|jgi:hypothetical protein|nr:hypothetical protein [Anaerolineae bacterium]
MEKYRIYEVTTVKIKPGKGAATATWWHDKGRAAFENSPGTKSVRVYGVQFGFGGEYQLEIWREIEEYGSYDRLDEDMTAHPEKYAAFSEATDVLEFGPTRLMGEWPQSQFRAPQE